MTARVPTSWIRREPDQSFRSLWYNMPFSCQSTSPPPLILLTAWTANSTVDLEVDRKPKHPFEYSLYSWFSLVLRLAPYFLSLLDDRLGFTYRKVYSSMSILLLLRITSDLICCSFAKYFGSGVIVSWLFGFMGVSPYVPDRDRFHTSSFSGSWWVIEWLPLASMERIRKCHTCYIFFGFKSLIWLRSHMPLLFAFWVSSLFSSLSLSLFDGEHLNSWRLE